MACPSTDEVQAYVDGTLAPEARAQIEQHTDGCRGCRELVAELVRTRTPPTAGDPPAQAPAPGPNLRTGDELGRYRIRRPLGAGAHGVVYAAEDPELGREVAVKVLRVDSPERRLRLLREAQSLARVSHPNVCAVYELGTAADGSVFIAMEFVDGGSLNQWLRTPRKAREILAAFAAAARGLAAAHAKAVIHRDFKPDNVLIGSDGRVRVTDFGLAGWMASGMPSAPQQSTPELTQTGTVMGTPLYMSPEQHLGHDAGEKSDQFSLCVALWQALYGARPFDGDDEEKLARSVLAGKIVPPARRPAGVSGRVARALRRGLATRPEDRHPSMAALAAELEPALPRRAIWIALAAFALAGGAAATVLIATRGRSAPSCRGAEARLAGVWDADRRAAVAHAFDKNPGHPHILQRLDDYANSWTTMVTQSCSATRVSGTQTEATMALREACLDERLAGLRALTHLLAAPDLQSTENAVSAVDRLPLIDDCAQVAALAAPIAVPPEVAPKVAAARSRLALARVLISTGARAVTAAEVRGAVADADATGYAPVRAEARLLAAEARDRELDHAGGEALLFEAFSLAESGHDDRTRARAAIAMIGELRWQARPAAELQRWVQLARATLERLGSDEVLGADLDAAIGLSSDGDVAIAALQRALAVRVRVFGEESLAVATTLEFLVLAYTAANDKDAAAAASARLRKITEARLGTDPQQRVLDLLLRLGDAENSGDFDAALIYTEQIDALVRDFTQRDDPLRLQTLLAMGQGYQLAKQPEKAIAAFLAAVQLARRLGRDAPEISRLECDLARQQVEAKHWDDALASVQRGLELPADDAQRADCWQTQGDAFLGRGNPRDAVAPLEHALDWRLHTPGLPASQVGNTQFALARALVGTGDPAQRPRARELAQAARASFQRHIDKFTGAPGVAARFVEYARERLRDLDAWVTGLPP